MDAPTIREARRLLHDLIFRGEAILSSGTMIVPRPEVLIPLIEKIAAKKVEETEVPTTMEDFAPKRTYHAITKGQAPADPE